MKHASVRVGRKHNTVWVMYPSGSIYRHCRIFTTREAAKALARKVRQRVRSGGALTPSAWSKVTEREVAK